MQTVGGHACRSSTVRPRRRVGAPTTSLNDGKALGWREWWVTGAGRALAVDIQFHQPGRRLTMKKMNPIAAPHSLQRSASGSNSAASAPMNGPYASMKASSSPGARHPSATHAAAAASACSHARVSRPQSSQRGATKPMSGGHSAAGSCDGESMPPGVKVCATARLPGKAARHALQQAAAGAQKGCPLRYPPWRPA
jgi:hypothetical protein